MSLEESKTFVEKHGKIKIMTVYTLKNLIKLTREKNEST